MSSSSIAITTAIEPTEELVAAFARLIPQLSRSAASPEGAALAAILVAESNTVLIAREEHGEIVGTLTLVTFPIPTGIRAWIEDVVVDTAARGRGVGEALCREALRIAQERGARTVELTSRGSRESANRLYTRIGFVQRETNVYRYDLTGQVGE